jgi:hypothetical protein
MEPITVVGRKQALTKYNNRLRELVRQVLCRTIESACKFLKRVSMATPACRTISKKWQGTAKYCVQETSDPHMMVPQVLPVAHDTVM